MAGCSAIMAANGAEALALLATRRPCLIILDLAMPVMGGSQMLEVMKRQPALATLPVLISTSSPSRAPAGFPVVPKPIDIDKIWEWIARTCRCSSSPPS